MTHKQQIVKVGQVAAKLWRGHLLGAAIPLLEMLWDKGCHSDDLSNQDKETARRVVAQIQAIRL